jgi:hypothetical protein
MVIGHCLDRRQQRTPQFRHAADVVTVGSFPKNRRAEYLSNLIQPEESPFGLLLEAAPVPRMFFRPEEIHTTSTVCKVGSPFSERNIDECKDALRLGTLDHPVTHHHAYRLAAVQTGRVDGDGCTGKQPADRQRLEASLTEPLLLSMHGDPVLRGHVVERRE